MQIITVIAGYTTFFDWALTGCCRSKHKLKCLFWPGRRRLSGTRVSPMNSLWVNLSSSQTVILGGRSREEEWRITLREESSGGEGSRGLRFEARKVGFISPQGFPSHVLCGYPIVDENLVPHRVQSVVLSAGLQFVGLNRKRNWKGRRELLRSAIGCPWLTTKIWAQNFCC